MLVPFLLYIVLPITLIALVINRFFGVEIAALAWITLILIAWTCLVALFADFFYLFLGDRSMGNFIWIVFEGPFVIWLGGKAYNTICSQIWQRNQRITKETEAAKADYQAKAAAARAENTASYADRYPSRPPEPY